MRSHAGDTRGDDPSFSISSPTELATYVEWGLTAVVTRSAQAHPLGVSGPRVNAEWELLIVRQSGRVTIETTATEAEPPDFEQRGAGASAPPAAVVAPR